MHVPIEPSLGNLPASPGVTANAGPVSFPYVATYFDVLGGYTDPDMHAVTSANFPYYDQGVNNEVRIGWGEVYCGLARNVSVPGGLSTEKGLVYLNLSGLHTSNPTGELSETPGGQLSLLLYQIDSETIVDYRGRLMLPLYS